MSYLKQGGEALLSMLGKPAGSDPRYRGRAPDRTEISFLRYNPDVKPGRGISARMQKSMAALRDPNNPMRQEILDNIENGLDVGEDWYNTEELRDWFIAGHGENEGHRRWSEYIDLVGAASPRSKVPPNIANASAINRRLYDNSTMPGSNQTYREALADARSVDDTSPIAKSREEGYGHLAGRNQELIVADQLRGGWSGAPQMDDITKRASTAVINPKPKGFAQSLKGSAKNFAADMHFTRFIAMASKDPRWLATTPDVSGEFRKEILEKFPKAKKYFGKRQAGDKIVDTFKAQKSVTDGVLKLDDIADYPGVFVEMPNDNEYKAFEDFMYELGQEMGLTGPQAQAALWMGAARKTKVADESQVTFMQGMRDRAATKAAETGQTTEQVLFDFIMNRGLLSAPFGAGGVLGALSMQEPQPGQPESPLYYNMRAQ